MSEREAFIRAICTDPADDTARLVFADWLEEHGESERAEYIRRQILTPSLDAHCFVGGHDSLGWFPGTHEIGSQAEYAIARGFIYLVKLPCQLFMRHAEEIFRQHPVTEVRLADRAPLHLPAYYEGHRIRSKPLWGFHATAHWGIDLAGLPWNMWFCSPQTSALGEIRESGCARVFHSQADAHTWLRELCVAYGRELAGLPQLPSGQPLATD